MEPTENKEVERIKSLRTYKGDVEEAISQNKYSASTILTAEQNKRDKSLLDFDAPHDTKARNQFFILIGSALLILGILTVSAVYYLRSNQQVVIEHNTKALISFAKEKDMSMLNMTKEQLVSNILSEKLSLDLPVNSVLYINTTDPAGAPAGIEGVISLIAPRIPGSLARSFDTKYMFGIYSFDTNEPFIILTTSDFAQSFAGMLEWEKNIPKDLGKLFSIPEANASSTRQFIDESLRNKDLRVLRDENKKILLVYSFIDKKTLIITTNESIFGAILGQYLVGQQVK